MSGVQLSSVRLSSVKSPASGVRCPVCGVQCPAAVSRVPCPVSRVKCQVSGVGVRLSGVQLSGVELWLVLASLALKGLRAVTEIPRSNTLSICLCQSGGGCMDHCLFASRDLIACFACLSACHFVPSPRGQQGGGRRALQPLLENPTACTPPSGVLGACAGRRCEPAPQLVPRSCGMNCERRKQRLL